MPLFCISRCETVNVSWNVEAATLAEAVVKFENSDPDCHSHSQETTDIRGHTWYDPDGEIVTDRADDISAQWYMLGRAEKDIRHDLHGYYICTREEAEHEDAGHNSVGFDGRDHYPTMELALTAAVGE